MVALGEEVMDSLISESVMVALGEEVMDSLISESVMVALGEEVMVARVLSRRSLLDVGGMDVGAVS
jgi:hypothetical protein